QQSRIRLGLDQRLIDETENHGLEIGAELERGARPRLDRRQHPLPVAAESNDLRAVELDGAAHLGRLVAEHRHAQIEPFELVERAQDALEERLTLDLEQRFGFSHASRLPGGQNERSEAHEDSPRRRVGVSTPAAWLASAGSTPRRTATSSAVMLSAISSGVTAPRSSPRGERRRLNRSSLTP